MYANKVQQTNRTEKKRKNCEKKTDEIDVELLLFFQRRNCFSFTFSFFFSLAYSQWWRPLISSTLLQTIHFAPWNVFWFLIKAHSILFFSLSCSLSFSFSPSSKPRLLVPVCLLSSQIYHLHTHAHTHTSILVPNFAGWMWIYTWMLVLCDVLIPHNHQHSIQLCKFDHGKFEFWTLMWYRNQKDLSVATFIHLSKKCSGFRSSIMKHTDTKR